jgi:hypothetical protein
MIQTFLPVSLVTLPWQVMVINAKFTDRNSWLGLLIIILIPFFIYFFVQGLRKRGKKRLVVKLEKNRLYFPEYLTLTIHNNGKKAIDIDNPLLVFSSLLMKRKLKLKGTNGYQFYPLYLESGKNHELKIELNQFYRYDRMLKKFPKATVYIRDVSGMITVSQSVQLRKTLFS